MATYKQIFGKQIKFLSTDPANESEGQIWYNSTSGTFKSTLVTEAWSAGANTSTSKQDVTGTGTQTAGLCFGGSPPSPPYAVKDTEEYNGYGWSTGGLMNTGAYAAGGFGTQTAAVKAAGNDTSGTRLTTVEKYDGTAWTAANAIGTARAQLATSSTGPQTAGIVWGGTTASPASANMSTSTEEFDGTNWSASPSPTVGNMITARYNTTGGGTQTALITAGGENPLFDASEEYDGSAWTTVNALPAPRGAAGAVGNSQTDFLIVAGNPVPSIATSVLAYDGTNWSASPAIATAGAIMGAAKGAPTAGLIFQGSSRLQATEEYNRTGSVITAGAWASGGAMGSAGYNISGVGPQTAGLGFARYTAPNKNNGLTEEYNGSSWSEEGDLATGRMAACGFGTQTAAVCAGGKQDPGSNVDNTEEYGGSTWTAGNALPAVRRGGAGVGILTAGVVCGGEIPAVTDTSLEYDGTNYTSGGTMSTARSGSRGSGTLTAGLVFGGELDPGASDATEEYNGTAWTNGGDMVAAVTSFGGSSAGTQSSSMSFGGVPNLATAYGYDGTAWSTRPSMGTGRQKLGGFGTGTDAVAFGGTTGPSTGTTATENFTGETSAANYKTITTS